MMPLVIVLFVLQGGKRREVTLYTRLNKSTGDLDDKEDGKVVEMV
jgi:hypothetical protein